MEIMSNYYLTGPVIRPTCQYDVTDFVMVAKQRSRMTSLILCWLPSGAVMMTSLILCLLPSDAVAPLGNKHNKSDVIMTSSYHVKSSSSPLTTEDG